MSATLGESADALVQAPVSARDRELRVVSGPSALGGGRRRFFHLAWLIATTDFKLSFYGSFLGYLWSLLRPLMFFGVLYLMFAVVITRFSTGVKDFPVLLLVNVVLITFFQEATGTSVPAVVVRENLVRKMHFPRLVIPIATVLTAGMNFVLNLAAVFVFMLVYGVQPRLSWLLFAVALIPLVLLTTGTAMLLSSLYVRYRDVAPIWGVVAQMLFYGSPIFYTIEMVAEKGHHLARWFLFNPIAMVMQQSRHWLVGGTPGVAAWMGGYVWLVGPLGIVVGVLLAGYWVFSRMAPEIAEEL
jgi:ABC-2 type transport system permease protein